MSTRRTMSLLWAVVFAIGLSATGASAGITYLGEGSIPGTATDQSRLTDTLSTGTPPNQYGGLGSAIAYTVVGNRYVATPDRGPADGTTSYIDRIYTIKLDIKKVGNTYTITSTLLATRLMQNHTQFFTGFAGAFDATNSPDSLRLDPEGVRVSACGQTAFVSDEYGPFIYEFDLASGRRRGVVPVPNKFLIDFPSANGNAELLNNISGRQANRGMEGLAISPDGTKLYGIMQSPLLQDHGLTPGTTTRVGTNNRIVEIDLGTGAIREFLYQLDLKSYGVNEILAINDHQFLVIERDGNGGNSAAFKKIFKIDITGATDIRNDVPIPSLPETSTPSGVTPVTKVAFINLLDFTNPAQPPFIPQATFPEKIEGLAFGPDLADGRHVLVVTNDNDFITTQANRFFVFAIDPIDLPGFTPQDISSQHRCSDEDQDDDQQ